MRVAYFHEVFARAPMSTKEEKKLRRLSFGHSRSSAGENSSVGDVVNSTGSLGDLKRAVLKRSKSNQGSSQESLAIELSEQPQHNFSSSGGESNAKDKQKRDKADKKKDKEKKKLKRRQSSEESVATTAACSTTNNTNDSVTPPVRRTPSPSSSSTALMMQSLQSQLHVLVSSVDDEAPSYQLPHRMHGGGGGDESVGQRPQRSQSYSEPHDGARPRTLSQGQRASLDQQGVFAKELRQITSALRQNAEQIAIMRAELETLHKLEMARQRMEMAQQKSGIDERIKEIDEETACCGLRCCGGLWDCLF